MLNMPTIVYSYNRYVGPMPGCVCYVCIVVLIVRALVCFCVINVLLYIARQKRYACQRCCVCQPLFVYITEKKLESCKSVSFPDCDRTVTLVP